jgi:hypothetical protein
VPSCNPGVAASVTREGERERGILFPTSRLVDSFPEERPRKVWVPSPMGNQTTLAGYPGQLRPGFLRPGKTRGTLRDWRQPNKPSGLIMVMLTYAQSPFHNHP